MFSHPPLVPGRPLFVFNPGSSVSNVFGRTATSSSSQLMLSLRLTDAVGRVVVVVVVVGRVEGGRGAEVEGVVGGSFCVEGDMVKPEGVGAGAVVVVTASVNRVIMGVTGTEVVDACVA